jgi:hydrogenase maturation factor HypE
MPKEVKQKSGLIVGINAGHSTFARPPFLARFHITRGTTQQIPREATATG